MNVQCVQLLPFFKVFVLTLVSYLTAPKSSLSHVGLTGAQLFSEIRRLVLDTARRGTKQLVPTGVQFPNANLGSYLAIAQNSFCSDIFLCSIKRRSAFRHHLRKHGIDPDAVDINALAPTLLRKPQSSSLHDFKPLNATPNVLYSNSTPYPYSQSFSYLSLSEKNYRCF